VQVLFLYEEPVELSVEKRGFLITAATSPRKFIETNCSGAMAENLLQKRVASAFGTVCLLAGAGLAVLIFVDGWTNLSLRLPRFWYTAKNFWVLLCTGFFVSGWMFHRHASAYPDEAVSDVVFRSLVMYCKPDCPLCDRAAEILSHYSHQLPSLTKIDVSDDPDLLKQHGDTIPVIQIDGRIRFRGVVSAELLERLIAAKRKQEQV